MVRIQESSLAFIGAFKSTVILGNCPDWSLQVSWQGQKWLVASFLGLTMYDGSKVIQLAWGARIPRLLEF